MYHFHKYKFKRRKTQHASTFQTNKRIYNIKRNSIWLDTLMKSLAAFFFFFCAPPIPPFNNNAQFCKNIYQKKRYSDTHHSSNIFIKHNTRMNIKWNLFNVPVDCKMFLKNTKRKKLPLLLHG